MNNHQWELSLLPRKWQQQALEIWKTNLRGIVSVVTGGGKTVFAFLCMLHFKEIYADGRIIIIVPTIALLDQWYVSLQEDLLVPEEDIACYSGNTKPSFPKTVNIIVINSARTKIGSLKGVDGTFLIVDECHRSGSPMNAMALEGKFEATLGISATPEREYDSGFEEYIRPILGDVIFTYSYEDAAKDHVITPFELFNVRIDLLPDEIERLNRLNRQIAAELSRIQRHDGSEDRLKRLLQRRGVVISLATMRVPVAVKLLEDHRGQRAIVFHERVSSANAMLSILERRGHSVTAYHSKIASEIRRDNLRLFKRGVFDILVCCRALDEGMNVPEAEIAIIASSTTSYRQRIQRLGRVLRPAKGKKEATIYTLYATELEEKRLAKEARSLRDVTSVTWLRGTSHDG